MATLTETFTNIANSIRLKTETTDKITPENMPTMIEGITTGGNTMELSITSNGTYRAPEGIDGYTPVIVNVPQDGAPPAEAFVISGDCEYRFANGGWDWFINQYGNQITTKTISNANYMFNSCNANSIPFRINFYDGGSGAIGCNSMFQYSKFELTDENLAGMQGLIGEGDYMFAYSSTKKISSLTFNNDDYHDYGALFSYSSIEEIGELINIYPSDMSGLFENCYYLKKPPKFVNPNWSRMNTYKYASSGGMFRDCYSLRSFPEGYFDNFPSKTKGGYNRAAYVSMYGMFNDCQCLDEIVNLPFFIDDDVEATDDIFYDTFSGNYRIKRLTFKTNEDGTPKVMKMKNQTINLSHAGYANDLNLSQIIGYSSGCTNADRVYWSADEFNNERHDNYLEQKDNPNWWTTLEQYSRYNKISAIETINSLPDTSAYLTSAGGTNTIKFEGDAGSSTDGGAINTMTEEEIAVATAKGWTVSFV